MRLFLFGPVYDSPTYPPVPQLLQSWFCPRSWYERLFVAAETAERRLYRSLLEPGQKFPTWNSPRVHRFNYPLFIHPLPVRKANISFTLPVRSLFSSPRLDSSFLRTPRTSPAAAFEPTNLSVRMNIESETRSIYDFCNIGIVIWIKKWKNTEPPNLSAYLFFTFYSDWTGDFSSTHKILEVSLVSYFP